MKRALPWLGTITLLVLETSGCGFIVPADTSLDIDEDQLRIALLAPSTDQELTGFSFDDTSVGATALISVLIKNFGELDAEGLTVTLTNSDGSSSPYAFAGGSYPGTSGALNGNCSDALESDATCALVLEFAPLSAGTFTGTLALSYFNGLATVETELEITGTALP